MTTSKKRSITYAKGYSETDVYICNCGWYGNDTMLTKRKSADWTPQRNDHDLCCPKCEKNDGMMLHKLEYFCRIIEEYSKDDLFFFILGTLKT